MCSKTTRREGTLLVDTPVDPGFADLPDVIPDWVGWDAPLPDGPTCDCACAAPVDRVGVVEELRAVVEALAAQAPEELPGAQALADGEALLVVEQQLRVLNLRRIGDVAARGLHELVGFRSAKSWVRAHRPDGDAGDARLAAQLRCYPQLREAVEEERVPLAGARKVALALTKVSSFVDRADGLIDGQPGDEVLPAVVQHVLALVCRHLLGLGDDDARLQEHVDRARAVLGAASQLDVIEGALSWLAEEIPARQLSGPLDEIVMALLPPLR
jgi:hypothetical protein